MRIGVVGSGDVGRALGGGLAAAGHEVKLGTRDPGAIDQARYLEPMAMVWITHFFNSGFNGNHAFKLLRK